MGKAENFNIASEQAALFVPVKQIDEPSDPFKVPLSDKIRIAIDAIKRELKQGFHPLVSVSFGKDSSVTLSLTLQAVSELQAEGFNVPTLHVLHSDTKLENVVVHAYNQSQIRALRSFAASSGIDIKVWVASREVDALFAGSIFINQLYACLIRQVGHREAAGSNIHGSCCIVPPHHQDALTPRAVLRYLG